MEKAGSVPSGRYGSGSCVIRDQLFIFGGLTDAGSVADDCFSFDPSALLHCMAVAVVRVCADAFLFFLFF